jgi:hypothetical protein
MSYVCSDLSPIPCLLYNKVYMSFITTFLFLSTSLYLSTSLLAPTYPLRSIYPSHPRPSSHLLRLLPFPPHLILHSTTHSDFSLYLHLCFLSTYSSVNMLTYVYLCCYKYKFWIWSHGWQIIKQLSNLQDKGESQCSANCGASLNFCRDIPLPRQHSPPSLDNGFPPGEHEGSLLSRLFSHTS